MHADRGEVFEQIGADGFAAVVARESADATDDFSLDGTAGVPVNPTSGAERDPRKDPRVGDMLAVGRDVREVVGRIQDSIEYGFPNRSATRYLPLMMWQVWARKADVRKAAP